MVPMPGALVGFFLPALRLDAGDFLAPALHLLLIEFENAGYAAAAAALARVGLFGWRGEVLLLAHEAQISAGVGYGASPGADLVFPLIPSRRAPSSPYANTTGGSARGRPSAQEDKECRISRHSKRANSTRF